MRWLLHFCLSVLIAIGVGWVAEHANKPASLTALLAIQDQAYAATSEFDPWELSQTVMAAAAAPSAWTDDPNAKLSAAMSEIWRADQQRRNSFRLSCIDDLFKGNSDILKPLCLNSLRADVIADTPTPTKLAPPSRFAGWAGYMPIPFLKPVIATADVLWHLPFAGTWTQTIVILLQCLVGFGAFKFWTRRESDTGFVQWVIGLPFCLVVLGSVSAFATKWLMLGGLALFGQLSSLAGLAAGAGGLVSLGWYLATRVLEVSASDALVSSVKKL